VKNVLEDINLDGRVRYGFNPSGPTNGRLSCQLLHQMPRIDQEKVDQGAAVLRSIFGEDDGYWYFYADFSQVELRIFSYLTGERELIEFLEQGKDIHKLTAAAALGIDFDDVSDENRANVGKRMNFGVIYGSKGHSIAKEEWENPHTGKKSIIGKERALKFVESFRERYPKVDEYLVSVPEMAVCRGGIVTSVFGRERRMHGLNDPDEYRRGHAEREATNFTISSPAAAITLRTIALVRRMLKDFDIGLDLVRPLNTVHDSIAYGVHDSMLEWFGPAFKAIAERQIPEIHGKMFPVKYGFGKTWTEAELNAG
jgi:DNA polymerase-1